MHSDVSKFTIVCFLISARKQLPSNNKLLIIRCVHAWERHREREREITIEWPTSSSWVDGPRYTPIAGIIMDAACCGWWWSPYFPSARKRKISISIIIQSISSLGGKGTKSLKEFNSFHKQLLDKITNKADKYQLPAKFRSTILPTECEILVPPQCLNFPATNYHVRHSLTLSHLT